MVHSGALTHLTPDCCRLDLTRLGLGPTSMRVRVGRNLAAFPLPGKMSKQDRLKMEQQVR